MQCPDDQLAILLQNYGKWGLIVTDHCPCVNDKQCAVSSAAAHRPSWRLVLNSFG